MPDPLPPTIGIRLPHGLARDRKALREFAAHVDASALDRVCVGDHVTFRDGTGFDGLQLATAVAAVTDRVAIETAVYLLPLRHPVPVARQVAALGWLAPGRFVFGVGVGGEDRREYLACGVDPKTRGRRLDESLEILRGLLGGHSVTRTGGLFELEDVTIQPAPPTPVPIIVGGRSPAALRRVARHGDGWLAVWLSPQRFLDGCRQIEEYAAQAARTAPTWEHGLHVWCGFGPDRDAARARLAQEMESLYGLPFERFERYCPYGSPAEVAEAIRPYVSVGCPSINLIAIAPTAMAAADGAARVRELLREGG
jgi:alkanesulfonate monooxygenase SsuD/methylene tetrahydromethanopterin reductase-like flavin-dependent oxidoreductase (luciferase family)